MKYSLIPAVAIIALCVPAAHAQMMVPPPLSATNAATASSSSETGSGAEAGVSGLGTAGVTTLSGNASTAGSTSMNGTLAGEPNLQINSIDTYSSTLGGTATRGFSSGDGTAHGGGGQEGSGAAYGQSYDPPLLPNPTPNAMMGESNSTGSSGGGAHYEGLSLGGTATIAGNSSTGTALGMNGVTTENPNLQVNSVITSSGSEGISSVLSGMSGTSAGTGGHADQNGNGNGWGYSWNVPEAPPAP